MRCGLIFRWPGLKVGRSRRVLQAGIRKSLAVGDPVIYSAPRIGIHFGTDVGYSVGAAADPNMMATVRMTDSNLPGNPNRDGPSSRKSKEPTPWLVLILPFAMVCLILCLSPNYQHQEGMRSGPLGGDFLQEWIGAKLFSSELQSHLYEPGFVESFQHDPSVVGFEWPAKDYFPMVYPPFYYAALQPLSEIDYAWASRIWMLISALALSISGYVMFRFYPPCRRVFKICFGSTVIFVPLLDCFNMGQKSAFLLLILTGTFVLLHHKRPFLSGLVFGLIVFKPHLGIVIGLAMLLKLQWKFAIGAVLVVIVAFGYSWINDSQLVVDYFQLLAKLGDYVQTGGYQSVDSHSLWGATQLTFGWLPSAVVKTITGLLSLLIVSLLWKCLRGRITIGSLKFALQFSAMVFAMVLLSPHFYGYDLTILLLPMILVVSTFPIGEGPFTPRDRCLGFVLLAIFLFAGLFSQIAGAIHVQPSIFLSTAVLVLLGFSRSKAS